MDKYTRITGKLFGETADPTNDPTLGPAIGQFGSAKAGTYNGTGDVATIQNLPAWSNGWIDAVTPNNQYPALPERTGVDKVFSYQQNYLLQQGLAEWDSGTKYYTTSYCQYNGGIYRSKIDANLNNTPSDAYSDENWQYLGKYFLNDTQITNCLLSVPNRINLVLDNGSIVAKAGSVVIFPYGTTDQSSTYTKGSSFGTGYTVYDTYWDSTNSKFFVYAELINDITGTQSTSNPCHIFLDTEGTMFIYNQSASLSGTTPSGTCTFLNTTTNTILRYSSGTQTGNQYCLPLGRLIFDSNAPYRITNIYEGIGAMGSICWADKGISALLPKGRNEDGSLINEVITSENLLLLDCSAYPSDFDQAKQLFFSGSTIFFGNDNYDNASNRNYSTQKLVDTVDRVPIGRFYLTATGRVGEFYGYNALNIGDYSDGRFVRSSYTIVNGSSVPTSSDATFDLSSYLPDDGREYEVLISGEVATGAASGNAARLYITTGMLISNVYLCRARTTANNAVYACGACTVPIGLDRSIKVIAAAGTVGTYYLHADGYRRIGING